MMGWDVEEIESIPGGVLHRPLRSRVSLETSFFFLIRVVKRSHCVKTLGNKG